MANPAPVPAPAAPPIRSADAAWVVIPTHLAPEKLLTFCRKVERLFRVNPYLEFKTWQETRPNSYHTEFRNLSNEKDYVLDLSVIESDQSIVVAYHEGIKKTTTFSIARTAEGSSLTVTDDYDNLTPAEREERIGEVDKSLAAWGEALRVYFRRQKRWGWFAPWRWYMNRVWMNMKPSARRISWLIFLITTVEFFFFVFVALIWWVEHR